MIEKVYEYNQHFVAMMNVINAARLNPPESGHKHHIIPRCWFKMNNLPVDNSEDNLVLLSYEDHQKVHKLAVLCACSSIMKSRLAYAYHRLTHGEVLDNNLWKSENHPLYGKHRSEETKRKMSAAHKGKTSPMKGKTLTDETCKKISEAMKGKKRGPYRKHAGLGKTWKLIDKEVD